ncbi:MAG: acyl-CoA reductase [Ruminiclostridium sp.]|nr:acyl-CoA reductase [Ruminiclostridium sp.]
MILFGGKLYETDKQNELLRQLGKRIDRTLCGKGLDRDTVISAADRLAGRIADGEYDTLIRGFAGDKTEYYKQTAYNALCRDNIIRRLETELPESLCPERTGCLRKSVRPLGTLFHIAAGNADGLPAMSVFEGLLTGNVNILKLPSADSGITIKILSELTASEPELADHIYVFDTPSSDIAAMQKMAALADGIAVWGGDEAVKAVRALADPGTRLIEWGHRLSFAYISGYEDKNAELEALAEHIASTGQLLCSSCQMIYLDTAEMSDIYDFCREFLPVLDDAARRLLKTDIGEAAQLSVRRYCKKLEAAAGYERAGNILYGKYSSLTACRNSTPELSGMFANVLVKRLPERYILPVLRRKKGTLQTAGLICAPEKRGNITESLIRSGVNRVMRAGNMSETYTGEVHDGEYTLRRYIRFTDVFDPHGA